MRRPEGRPPDPERDRRLQDRAGQERWALADSLIARNETVGITAVIPIGTKSI
jgi:hypothetical protein